MQDLGTELEPASGLGPGLLKHESNLHQRLSTSPPRKFAAILHGAPRKTEETPLPILVVEGGRKKQFVWDGYRIARRDVRSHHSRQLKHHSLLAFLKDVKHNLHRAFFPKRDEVTEDYWAFVSWRAGHRLSSAMLGNFATQSLLAAVGVGVKQQLPAAASINWLLKDGLGRLGRLCVAACLGHKFDSQLKRYRWVTSIMFTGATALEFMAPLMPQHFLFLASVANVGKAVGVTTYVATHPAFMRSFARGDNLADINAKGQAQQMVMDTLGLALCVALTYGVRHSPRGRVALPLAMFPCLALADLFCIFKELKATHLRSLNQERAEILVQEWLSSGVVLSPQQVSAKEHLLLPRQNSSNSFLPLNFLPVEKLVCRPDELMALTEQYREQNYLLNVLGVDATRRFGRLQPDGIALTLREGASSGDVLTAILQAEILRQFRRGGGQECTKNGGDGHNASRMDSPLQASLLHAPEAMDAAKLSLHLAPGLLASLCADLKAANWQTDSFLIPAQQKDGYIT